MHGCCSFFRQCAKYSGSQRISGLAYWFSAGKHQGEFFAISGIVNSIFTAAASFGASLLADAATASGRQMYWMSVIRMAAFVLALLELALLLIPRELEYPKSQVKGKALLLLPLGNRQFCMTMIPVFAWMMIPL